MSKVTVLVAAYNAANYLERCLESLLGQTLTDIQIICVDDASTDSTPQIIEHYSLRDKRIVAIYQKENSGQAKARNRALTLADGEYITMVDSDDWLSVDALQRAVDQFTLYPQTDCVMFELLYSDAKSQSRPYTKKTEGSVWRGKEAFRLSLDWSIHGLYVATAHLYREFPFDDSCRLYSDDNTTRLHYLHSREVRQCSGVYYYRLHPDQATRSFSIRRFDLIEANISMAKTLASASLNQPDSVLAFFERERWINLAGMHGLYRKNRKRLTSNDRQIVKERLKRGYNSFDFKLLPAAIRFKFGYFPLGSYKIYRLQSSIYFFLRDILKRGEIF
ncbi:MAG TPA: glycosyltransferase family A protein [Bacteroidaceae bacterium]|nr:glycosyltransferase family A protein [Bacteroidaceae bacterium]